MYKKHERGAWGQFSKTTAGVRKAQVRGWGTVLKDHESAGVRKPRARAWRKKP